MTGVTAIHHPLRDIDASPSKVRPVVYVRNLVDWSAVNAHANGDIWMVSQRVAYFEGAPSRLLRALEKQKRHAISSRQTNQFLLFFSFTEATGTTNDSIKLLHALDLFVDQQLRIANDIDE